MIINDNPGAALSWDMQGGGNNLSESGGFFPIVAFLGMALVLVFLVNHMYRSKQKPRRKKPRLRRLQVTGKVAGV